MIAYLFGAFIGGAVAWRGILALATARRRLHDVVTDDAR